MASPPIDFRRHKNRALRAAVFTRDGFRCQLCGWQAKFVAEYDGRFTVGAWPHADERMLHVDHRIPRHLGGSSDIENLQALCEACNCRKAGR